jgi:hypothetical protein
MGDVQNTTYLFVCSFWVILANIKDKSEQIYGPARFRVPVSGFRSPVSEVRNADTGIPENRKLA